MNEKTFRGIYCFKNALTKHVKKANIRVNCSRLHLLSYLIAEAFFDNDVETVSPREQRTFFGSFLGRKNTRSKAYIDCRCIEAVS